MFGFDGFKIGIRSLDVTKLTWLSSFIILEN